jgi:hypothetical protein
VGGEKGKKEEKREGSKGGREVEIAVLRRLRQDDYKFESSLGYAARSCP